MKSNRVAAACRAHDALVAALNDLERAESNAVLCFARVMHEKYYKQLGHRSIYVYAKERLSFSESKTAQFVSLAKKIKKFPRLGTALAKDEVTWTAARAISGVLTPETQEEWLERARTRSRRQLVADVRSAKKRTKTAVGQTSLLTSRMSVPKAAPPPVRFTFELTALQAARAQSSLERLTPGRDRAEVLLEALAALVASEQQSQETCTRVQIPAQVVSYQCEDCQNIDVPAVGDLKRLSPLDAHVVQCDADRVDRNGHKRSVIPITIRRKVLARDRHRCVRCGHTNFVQVHHRRPRSDGGRHSLENCVTVCAPCHRIHHQEEDALMAGAALERMRPSLD